MRFLAPILFVACKGAPAGDPTPVDTDLPVIPTDPVVEPDLLGVALVPSRPLVQVGASTQVRAYASWSDGTLTNVSSEVAWSAADPTLAAVDPTGLITAAAAGDPGLTGAFRGQTLTGLAHVYPSGVTLSSVGVYPPATTVNAGGGVLLSARGTLTDGVTGDLGASCSWESTDLAVATVGAAGVVQAVGEGTASVTASCADGLGGTSTITVQPQGAIVAAPDLYVEELFVVLLGPDRFRLSALVGNDGGHAGPFAVDLTADSAALPGSGDVRVGASGVGPGDTVLVEADLTWTGARPADLTSWVQIDPDGAVPDTDVTNQSQSIQHVLPGDVLADVEVVFDSAIVFGPTDAGVVITATNHGPEPITDLVLWFERDQPGATSLSDLDPQSAEASEVVGALAVGASYTWVFTYDQIPYPDPWTSCGFAVFSGVSDPDLSNNLDCIQFSE